MTSVPITVVFVYLLLERVPELRTVYEEHIRDNDELLPHVWLGDVSRYIVQQVRSGETGPATSVERILSALDQWLAFGDEHVKELVSVSFVENLVEHDDVLESLKGLLGPNLENELRRQGK